MSRGLEQAINPEASFGGDGGDGHDDEDDKDHT
jgi:hypothetical protein